MSGFAPRSRGGILAFPNEVEQFLARMHAQLRVAAAQMGLHRVVGQVQLVGYVDGAPPAGVHLEYFLLALRQARNVHRFGELLGELFVCRQDPWGSALRRMGASIGKFVYLMDAVVDYEDDVKSGSYNPLVAGGIDPNVAREPLLAFIGEAVQAFERLPLEQDIHILRSVLYAGVWGTYNERFAPEDKATATPEQHGADDGDGPL